MKDTLKDMIISNRKKGNYKLAHFYSRVYERVFGKLKKSSVFVGRFAKAGRDNYRGSNIADNSPEDDKAFDMRMEFEVLVDEFLNENILFLNFDHADARIDEGFVWCQVQALVDPTELTTSSRKRFRSGRGKMVRRFSNDEEEYTEFDAEEDELLDEEEAEEDLDGIDVRFQMIARVASGYTFDKGKIAVVFNQKGDKRFKDPLPEIVLNFKYFRDAIEKFNSFLSTV